jgi:hypothetical protein
MGVSACPDGSYVCKVNYYREKKNKVEWVSTAQFGLKVA